MSSTTSSLVCYNYRPPDQLSAIAEVSSTLSRSKEKSLTRPEETEASHLAAIRILEELMERIAKEAEEFGEDGNSVDSEGYRQAVHNVVVHGAVRIVIQFVDVSRFFLVLCSNKGMHPVPLCVYLSFPSYMG